MKFKKIQSLLRQIKTIQIRHGETAQWIGDGSALYPIYNLPELTERAIQTILDIDDDAWDKYDFEDFPIMKISEEDVIEGMKQLDRLEITIHWKGRDLKPFDDDISYWLRNDPALCDPIIGVQEGMCIGAFVMPIRIDDKVFAETLYRMYALVKHEIYGDDE